MHYAELEKKLTSDYSDHWSKLTAMLEGMPEDRKKGIMGLVSAMVATRDEERSEFHHQKWLKHCHQIEDIVKFNVEDCGGIEKAINAVLKHGNDDEIACVLRNSMEAVVHHHLQHYSEQ